MHELHGRLGLETLYMQAVQLHASKEEGLNLDRRPCVPQYNDYDNAVCASKVHALHDGMLGLKNIAWTQDTPEHLLNTR